MNDDNQGISPEKIARLIKEAGLAVEQIERTKKLRSKVNSMVDSDNVSIVQALKELLKQPKKS